MTAAVSSSVQSAGACGPLAFCGIWCGAALSSSDWALVPFPSLVFLTQFFDLPNNFVSYQEPFSLVFD